VDELFASISAQHCGRFGRWEWSNDLSTPVHKAFTNLVPGFTGSCPTQGEIHDFRPAVRALSGTIT
jgi:hypothetical protein